MCSGYDGGDEHVCMRGSYSNIAFALSSTRRRRMSDSSS